MWGAAKLTGIAVPVEVVTWVAVALVVGACLLAGWAVGKRHVVVGDVVKKVEFILVEHDTSRDRVHRSVAPTLVEESTVVVEGVEEIDVSIAAEPVEVTNLEVGPEVAVVVGLAVVVAEEGHGVVLGNVLGELLHEALDTVPQSGDRLDVFVQTQHERVLLAIIGHELERVVIDVTEELNAGLDAPVPLVVKHQLVTEEEARLVATHVAVADGVAVDDILLLHLIAHLGRLGSVDPRREGPLVGFDLAILGLAGNERGGDTDEGLVKVVVVEEDPVVVELAVEAVLDLANGAGDLPDVRVASQGDEGSVHALTGHGAGQSCRSVRGGARRRASGVIGSVHNGSRLGARLGGSARALPFGALFFYDLAGALQATSRDVGGGEEENKHEKLG